MSVSARPEPRPAGRRRSAKAQWNVWLRWVHTYTSMISLLIVLFFSVSGITLNHPEWTLGIQEVKRTVSGTLSPGWTDQGKVNWLAVAEQLRADQGLKGRAGNTTVNGGEADISFLAPGYSADAFIDVKTGKYTVNVLEQGSLAVFNDLHRGRDAGTGWRWAIDLSGLALTLISLTGIGILLFLKKTRRPALTVMGIGLVLTVALAVHAAG
ncbi:PepSY-associated TM helix domain-containing protein [uncultured Deinococcus sp.]|uniref:PepSY-associated TM helix domain-containing protein n=1 Tax=uncultured Deinococcus sp. TaxID=158789 RepID=UPI000A061D89|nr:PepSY-associated TM helix domain-containing protein [uncultured Deinococcus sp.]